MSFPSRALVGGADFLPEVQQELSSRGIPVVTLQTPRNDPDWQSRLRAELAELKISSTDFVMALPGWCDVALEALSLTVPTPPDYPGCIRHMLGREVWQSTLRDVQQSLAAGTHSTIFIKPAAGAKGFSGTTVTGPMDGMLDMLLDPGIFPGLGPDLPVWCSELVKMNSEYAVYVVDGTIRSMCHYMCKSSSCRCKDGELAAAGVPPVELDTKVIDEAVRLMAESEETRALTGYRADFALVQRGSDDEWETCLVEVNDGYVSGRYDGMPPKDFTDMMLSRFRSLQQTADGPGSPTVGQAI